MGYIIIFTTILLVLLKCLGTITCSWLWVFCLLWGPPLIGLGISFVLLFIWMIIMLFGLTISIFIKNE